MKVDIDGEQQELFEIFAWIAEKDGIVAIGTSPMAPWPAISLNIDPLNKLSDVMLQGAKRSGQKVSLVRFGEVEILKTYGPDTTEEK